MGAEDFPLSPVKRRADDTHQDVDPLKRMKAEGVPEDNHPNIFLTYMLKGSWLGQSMLIDFNKGKVTDRYITQSIHGIKGDRFSRLTRRIYTDGRLQTSFFNGEFEDNFEAAVFRASGTKWRMMAVNEDMVVISSLADADDPKAHENHLLADSVITRSADGHYIHTRQIVMGSLVQLESVRSRRVSGENIFLEKAEDAPPVDMDALKPHLRILHEMEAQAKRQMSQAILIYPGATTPTGSLTATPADSLDNTASQEQESEDGAAPSAAVSRGGAADSNDAE